MAKLPTKKGPRMTTCSQTASSKEEVAIEAEITSFAHKLHDVLEEARSKMTDEEREKADRRAKAILERASAAAPRSRRRA